MVLQWFILYLLVFIFFSTKTQKIFLRFGRCVSFGLAP